ncbi:MAG: decaprenyl-phosphate phosphoribosyltransferase [Solirubrobacteraceae bacterium]|nr:decaprenyl-phosphate phosphoribosyltransferase [Solirubrobacterales bacterium]MEA2217214.1 decaprenyl-phosphate phosphoribosyltransferase [Solirubrobacteraceae bacterium]
MPAAEAVELLDPEGVHRGARATAWALLRACRPKQWVKNLLVLAAPGAAGILTRPEVPGRLAVTFIAFCALSSCTYLLNDLHDRHEDRLHPRRRDRPIASGAVSPALAVGAAVALAAGGLGLALMVRPWLAGVGLAYLLLTGSYTLWWRSVAVADMASISCGFILRALAGGVATDITVSRWFLLVTSFGALFLVAGKRYAELRTGGSSPTRASLNQYSERYLRFVIGLSATITTTAYCLWAFQRSHQARLSWYELTVIPFVLWLLRYALLIEQGGGEAPEETVFSDRFLLTVSAAWAALFISGVYVAG